MIIIIIFIEEKKSQIFLHARHRATNMKLGLCSLNTMIMNKKQRKIKIEPRIKLNYNISILCPWKAIGNSEVSKAKIVKESTKLNWNFQRGGGSKPKTLP